MIVCPYCGTTNDDNATTCRTCGASLTGAKYPTALPLGTKLQAGKYVIESVLGQGGFGITYKAKNAALGIPVVVKEYHPQGASRAGSSMRPPGTLTASEFKEARARFADEARVVAQMTLNDPNPNIVRVYDVFTENDTEYYTMEFLDGKPLSKLVEKQGPFPEADVLTIAAQLVGALVDVHATGMLHRDIKPDNVMMVARGAVLIDFGSARSIAAGGRMSIIVTPGYAPLEQYASEAKRGPFTDVYALGATLFYALTGQEPVAATDRASGVKQPTAREVNSRISKGMSDAIDRAMRMKIDERPQTAAAFLADLQKSVGKLPASTIGQVRNGTTKAATPIASPTPSKTTPPATNPPDPNQSGAYRRPPTPGLGLPNPPAGSVGNQPVPQTPPAARGASPGGNFVLGLFVIFGGMILLGELGYLPNQVAVAGFYLVVLLAAYLLIQWLVFTRTGRILLFVIVAAAAAAYYFYSQGAFGAPAPNTSDLLARQYADTVLLKASQYYAQNASLPTNCMNPGLNLDGKIVVSAPRNITGCTIATSNAGKSIQVRVTYSGGTSSSLTAGR